MIRKVLFIVFIVPLILCLAFEAVTFVSAVLAGEITLASWIMSNRMILAIIVCYIALRFIGPFKKD